MLVRVVMPPGEAHQLHRHPAKEEILYYVSGGRSSAWGKRVRCWRQVT